jgi:hypothetical protein
MKKYIPVIPGIILSAFIILLFSCSKGSSGYGSGNNNPPPPPSGNSVDIYNMAFSPTSLTIKAGTTVTWTNSDSYAHTVTANDNSFDSGNLGSGKTFSKTFSTAGTYPYHCNIHASMKATIIVQ